ncbi:ATP synthase F0 subunit B [Candidatus Nomurabacteria bacterium]|nr:ATP synthase F0 subunit B [Candidatus Nomurabacteria bacterium]
MDSIITTFHIDWKIVIAQALNFGIVFAVLFYFAIKPLHKLMQERSTKIEKGIDDAKTNADLLKATTEEYEKAIAKARIEANEIFDKNKKEAEKKKAEILEQAQKEMIETIENGKKIIEAERVKMLGEVKNEVAGLVLQATEKVLAEKNK